eukprot:CAMPEP_0197477986 /NCGR_PEP_ID=MMETSP1309-20131121/22421_1 /TAXON_ID=464262 /ORGANISM="Genus nov. species nov., Strain RCC998" /LENGTH=294 /DNA_ID=CAMNT_0043019201 /DNA_START=93 /DNA_END=977 /DNA_ORIENTATION=+
MSGEPSSSSSAAAPAVGGVAGRCDDGGVTMIEKRYGLQVLAPVLRPAVVQVRLVLLLVSRKCRARARDERLPPAENQVEGEARQAFHADLRALCVLPVRRENTRERAGAQRVSQGAQERLYLANHSSTLDFVTCSRVLSTGTIAVAKKALLFHPLGWVAWLNGTIFIDRSNREKAIKSMNSIGKKLTKHGLSICVFPEGTRSKDGRLQPFKKGAMHLAMQTGCPIVPVVFNGAHKIWGKYGYRIACNAEPIRMTFLPPIDTKNWTAESLEEHTKELHGLFVKHLDEEARPLKQE